MKDFSTLMRGLVAGGARTRCAGLPPTPALVILLLLGLSLVASLSTVRSVHGYVAAYEAVPESEISDYRLYQGIAAQVRAGRPYYAAAIEAQRKHHYPVRPFFTVRLPTLSWLVAGLSPMGAQALLLLLAVVTVKAWSDRMAWNAHASRGQMAIRIGLIVCGIAPALIASGMWFTEVWAGLLIALSLALRTPDRWWPSVAVALVAVLLRELSLPYLLAMGLLALFDGRRREAIGWGGAVAVFAVVFAAHAHGVLALTQAGDLASPGWNGRGGWALFVSSCMEMTLLTLLPALVVAALLPLSLFGMAAWKTPLALRTLVTLCGYTLLIALFARPDNHYWVWMINPILLLGLLIVPNAMADLVRSIGRRSAPENNGTMDDQRH